MWAAKICMQHSYKDTSVVKPGRVRTSTCKLFNWIPPIGATQLCKHPNVLSRGSDMQTDQKNAGWREELINQQHSCAFSRTFLISRDTQVTPLHYSTVTIRSNYCLDHYCTWQWVDHYCTWQWGQTTAWITTVRDNEVKLLPGSLLYVTMRSNYCLDHYCTWQ